MKKALIATLWGSVFWGFSGLAQEPFAIECDGYEKDTGARYPVR